MEIMVYLGLDKDDEKWDPIIPHVSKIQDGIIRTRMRQINQDLTQTGSADLRIRGLLPESVDLILSSCAAGGYSIWKRKTSYDASGEYSIGVTDSYYLQEYYERVENG